MGLKLFGADVGASWSTGRFFDVLGQFLGALAQNKLLNFTGGGFG